MPEFLHQFHPGERPALATSLDHWTDEDRAVWPRHTEYLRQATEDGIVVMAGMSQDWVGPTIIVLETDTEEEARRFMEADPFVAEGVFTATLHPFRLSLRRQDG